MGWVGDTLVKEKTNGRDSRVFAHKLGLPPPQACEDHSKHLLNLLLVKETTADDFLSLDTQPTCTELGGLKGEK